jgi:hypothetical protein
MTHEQYLQFLKEIKPSPRMQNLFLGYEHLLVDRDISLRSQVRIALGIADYEAGYPGGEACFSSEEQFNEVSDKKFQDYFAYWQFRLYRK